MDEGFDQAEEELFAQIGVTLILLQDLEDVLSHCLNLVFGDEHIITVEELLATDKRPLGKFIRQLKSRVALDKGFESLLNELVEERNTFVHRLRLQPWFKPETKEGREATWRFLSSLSSKLETATMTFQAFAFKQARDLGAPETPEERILRERGFMQELERHYFPRLSEFVKRKK
jgi:hypothetical protein